MLSHPEVLERPKGRSGARGPQYRKHGDPVPICQVEGCPKPADIRLLCKQHYANWRRRGHPLLWKRRPQGESPPPCKVEDCSEPPYGHGYCKSHWGRWWLTGNPLPQPRKHHGAGCIEPDCELKRYAQQRCSKHYRALREIQRQQEVNS